jgi:hypothetical protein
VDPRAGLDAGEKILDSNSDCLVVQPTASPYTDCAIPVWSSNVKCDLGKKGKVVPVLN